MWQELSMRIARHYLVSGDVQGVGYRFFAQRVAARHQVVGFVRDLEVCVLDYDGIVHALMFPCHKDGAEWVDASNRKPVDIQPTHWRKWTETH